MLVVRCKHPGNMLIKHFRPQEDFEKLVMNKPINQMIRYIRNSRTISGRLHDELVNDGSGAGEVFFLNPVATRIWELLEEPLSPNELCMLSLTSMELPMSSAAWR
jgi:hypothetical protein